MRLAAEGATVAACDLDGAAARETVRLLGGPGSDEGAPRGAHAAFQVDVSEAGAVRRLLDQVQVKKRDDLAPFKALTLLYMVFWCVTYPLHRPAFLVRHLSLCPVRASPGMSFCSTCLRTTGTES